MYRKLAFPDLAKNVFNDLGIIPGIAHLIFKFLFEFHKK
jgi:hypothetical protein